MSYMYDTDYGRSLDAENFLLEPVIEYLRGYKKITNCQDVIAKADEVVRNETKVILAARERVLDAFRSTVEDNSDDDGGGGDADTERGIQRPYAVREKDAHSPGGKARKTRGRSHGDAHTRRWSPGKPKPVPVPVVAPEVRPEDSMSQRQVRSGSGVRLNEALPSSRTMVGRGKHLPIGPARQPVRWGSHQSSNSSHNHNGNGQVEFFSVMEDLHRWDQNQSEPRDPVIALYHRVDRWRSGHPQSFITPSEYTSK